MEMGSDECLGGTPYHKPSCSTPDAGFEPFAPSSLHESDLQGVSALANVDITTTNVLVISTMLKDNKLTIITHSRYKHVHSNEKLMYSVYFLLKKETLILISDIIYHIESVYS